MNKAEKRGRYVKHALRKVGREEWLELRREGIGGSDAAIIAGLNRFGSEMELWADKKGLAPEKEATEAMKIGVELEDYVARRWMEETGKRCVRRQAIFGNRNYPWALGNIDREVVKENAGLECKTTNPFSDYDFEGGEVPPWYYAQCVHYMAVCGFDKMYLAVLVLGKGFFHYEIKRDEEEIAVLMEEEKRWWEAHIEGDKMPEPDGSDGAGKLIGKMYKGNEGTEVFLAGCDGDLKEYQRLGEEIKGLKKEQEAAKQRVQLRMGDAVKGESQKFRVTWAVQESARVDTKKLKEQYPTVFADCAKVSRSRVFRVKEIS